MSNELQQTLNNILNDKTLIYFLKILGQVLLVLG